jgi:hypothetical protein
MPKSTENNFYAITSYFNPFHNADRIRNYKIFRQNLKLPLVTVEWAPDGIFELTNDDADEIIQISGGDIIWQKERLLNIALESIPSTCEYLAWLDSDIIFSDPNWHERAIVLLEKYDFIQLFNKLNYLTKLASESFSFDQLKLQPYHASNISILEALEPNPNLYLTKEFNDASAFMGNGNPGMAFAAKFEVIKAHQFYDKNIVGGGDTILIASILNKLADIFTCRPFSPMHRSDIQNYGDKVSKEKYKATYLHETIYHLWHGELLKRQYASRYNILIKHNYDPTDHITYRPNMPLSWKNAPEGLKQDLYQYMYSRENQ